MKNSFTIIDLETTGLFPEKNDKIIEIALVRVEPDGTIGERYTSLINPMRDVGPTSIHGIEAKDVFDAPKFTDIAGGVAQFIKGSIPVAHNAIFDRRFIQSEFARLGYDVSFIPWLCTLKLCSKLCDGLPSRKLHDCCDYFGIELIDAHTALADAIATAGILSKLVSNNFSLSKKFELNDFIVLDELVFHNWPNLNHTSKPLNRSDAKTLRTAHNNFITKIIEHLPGGNITDSNAQQYLDILDRVLEDRKITLDECELLLEIATKLELTQEAVKEIHLTYLKDLITLAWADHELSNLELKDLKTVQELLSISDDKFNYWNQKISADILSNRIIRKANSSEDLAGKSFCFTGEFQHVINGERVSRSSAIEIAQSFGILVKSGVTKKLDCLVAADSDSMSGKARKAREYGIRIISEPAFWKMLGY